MILTRKDYLAFVNDPDVVFDLIYVKPDNRYAVMPRQGSYEAAKIHLNKMYQLTHEGTSGLSNAIIMLDAEELLEFLRSKAKYFEDREPLYPRAKKIERLKNEKDYEMDGYEITKACTSELIDDKYNSMSICFMHDADDKVDHNTVVVNQNDQYVYVDTDRIPDIVSSLISIHTRKLAKEYDNKD